MVQLVMLRPLLLGATVMLLSAARGQGFTLEIGPPLAQDGIGVVEQDGGFVVGARLHATNPSRHLAGLWRFSGGGAPIELDTLHAITGNAFPQALAPGADGSCFLAGSAIPTGGHDHEAFVLKRASDGTIAWIARPSWPGSRQFLGVHGLDDGGALACGVAVTTTGHDALIARFAPDGSLMWSALADAGLDEEAHAITLVGDAVIATGRQVNFGGTSDAWFGRYALDGTLVWTTTWGGVGNEEGRALVPVGANGFLMAGVSNSFGLVDQTEQRRKRHAYVLALDLNGDSLWTRVYGDTLHDQYALGIALAGNGDAILCGERSTVTGISDAFAARIDPTGSLLWERTWDLGKEERLLSVAPLPDGFITTGWAFNDLARQVILLRRDPGGN